jgi:hypothetical protein
MYIYIYIVSSKGGRRREGLGALTYREPPRSCELRVTIADPTQMMTNTDVNTRVFCASCAVSRRILCRSAKAQGSVSHVSYYTYTYTCAQPAEP